MNHVELVAPAGSFETLEAAIAHGADAVYIGVGPFNLRARAPHFDVPEAITAIKSAHTCGRKIYAAMNTMPSDDQLAGIERVLADLSRSSEPPDAVIVSDPGVLRTCMSMLPGVAVHLSTQTGTFNSRSMSFWREQGVRRIVLPRELTIEEVRGLSGSGICETEVFVHGAMCVSISGRCLLGAYLAGRHPNRGDCPQPCRYRYSVTPLGPGGEDGGITVEENEQGAYLLNSRDLNTVSILNSIVTCGVKAIKIEGRNKSVHYVSSVVKTYRAALDAALSDPQGYRADTAWETELERLDHRPYTTGFYAGEYMLQEVGMSKARQAVRVVGIVKETLAGGRVAVEAKNPFRVNETLNVLPARHGMDAYDTSFFSIVDLGGSPLEKTPANRVVVCSSSARLRVGDIVRRLV